MPQVRWILRLKKKIELEPAERPAELKRSALAMLARRDYARRDLHDRLAQRYGAGDDLDQLLDWLEAQRFIDDARYAGMFLRSRLERGHGPMRVRQSMQQEGLSAELIETALAEADVDWFEQARQCSRRRFSGPAPADPRERAKRLRFLQYRGFTADQCFYALDAGSDDD